MFGIKDLLPTLSEPGSEVLGTAGHVEEMPAETTGDQEHAHSLHHHARLAERQAALKFFIGVDHPTDSEIQAEDKSDSYL